MFPAGRKRLVDGFFLDGAVAIPHDVETLDGSSWRKRSIPTHSEWLYPLTFDAGKGLKEA